MFRTVSVAVVSLLATFSVVYSAPDVALANATPCAKTLAIAGQCAVQQNDSNLSITATETHSSPVDATPDARHTGTPRRYPRPDQNRQSDVCAGIADERCRATAPQTPPAPRPAAPGPALTITDVAQFAPDPAATSAEPSNIGVAGLPTNFLTPTAPPARTGTLLGTPITVRFTPVRYDFVYGDGTTASTTAPGLPWAALRQSQLTPTPTSHVYRARGTYTATTAVHYTAELDTGSGWVPLPGELTIPGPGQAIRIYEATTALVRHTCTEQPTAPGC